ncbi:MAG: hypothetical protein K2G44_04245 [Clostridia bacterium]|nr:hypothetical protein [Clostridia bacterium]
MKKVFVTILVCLMAILTLTLTACGDDENGTYYPTNGEMKTNLENGGYTVTVTTDLGDKNGTLLSALKDNEYIEFYWLDNAEDCEYFYNLLEENHANYNSLVQIENDEKFGNIVYCGTENAISISGIKVIKIKV